MHINSIVLWGFIPFGVAFIFSGIMRATGTVWPPLLAMVISLWGVRVPLANFLEPSLGADAIWLAFPAGSTTTLLLAGGYYLWGPWRKSRMLPSSTPHGDQPDTGLSPPGGIEETEVSADAEEELSHRSPSAPRTPVS